MKKSTILRTDLLLVCLFALWLVSILLVAFPNIGKPVTTFPAKVTSDRLVFLFSSAASTAIYSSYMGVKWLKSARD